MLPQRPYDALQRVAPKVALGDRLDGVPWKLRAKKRFELQFKNLSLQLLGALFGPPLQFLNLASFAARASLRDAHRKIRFRFAD
jgi:hypothetical protein